MKAISPAALNALRDALVRIYWYKNDLRSFVTGCLPAAAVPRTVNWQANKRDTVNHLVDYLAARPTDHLLDTIHLMEEVARFKDFSHLEVLDDGRQKAKLARAAVAALKNHLAGHLQLVEEQQEAKQRREEARQTRLSNEATQERLNALQADYVQLVALPEQKRGYALEGLMNGLFDVFDLDPKRSFHIEGEQIDGAFSFEGTDYLLEARWRQKPTPPKELDSFHRKIERKLENTLGLFLSISGFTVAGVRNYSNQGSRMILMDGADLMAVLESRIALDRLLLLKRRKAAQRGEIYVSFDRLLKY